MKKILLLLSLLSLLTVSTSLGASLTDDPFSLSGSGADSSFSDDMLSKAAGGKSAGADSYGQSDSYLQSDSSFTASSSDKKAASTVSPFPSSTGITSESAQQRQDNVPSLQTRKIRDIDQDLDSQQSGSNDEDYYEAQQEYDAQQEWDQRQQYFNYQQRQGYPMQQFEADQQDLEQLQLGSLPQNAVAADKGKADTAPNAAAQNTTPNLNRRFFRPAPPSPVEKAMSENPVTAEKVRPLPFGNKQLRQFGYTFFRKKTSFAPLTDVPVGPDYIINPGDRVVITVWGGFDGTFHREVNRNGEIVLPKVGAVKVAGQTYGQLPELIKVTFSRIYKNVNLNVTMGKLKLIKVYVVGEVKGPGDYNVSSLSTVISALSAAGGPSKNGSLRNIQIKRNGNLVQTVDLYDFFLNGDKGKDVRLQAGDTILVPVIGPVVGVSGNVRRPAIYELKGERTLKDVLSLAGRVNPSGYLQRVQLYRVQAHDKKIVSDFNLDLKGAKSADDATGAIAVQDYDLVKVLPIDTVLRGYVRLTGHVLRPGDYALKPGMKVSALMGGDNLLPEYYTGAGEIIRLCPPDQHPEAIFFDLSKALKGDPANDLELKEFDRVKIFTRQEMKETPYVKVSGEVQKPGQVRYLENMTVRDLLMQAGNLKNDAYLKNAEITRLEYQGDKVTSHSVTVDLEKALQGGAENIKLQPFDELTVRRIPNWAESTERYVTLRGEFVFPGTYPIHKGERLSSVIERAGGFSDRAYLLGAKFTREVARQLQQQRMDEALVKAQEDIIKLQTKMAQTAASPEEAASAKETLAALMQGVEVLKKKKAEGRMLVEISSLRDLKASVYDLELQGGDVLSVPSDPGGVNVIGDVYNQNTVVSQPGKSVDWYMSQVGGPTADADLGEVYVVKVDGSVISQKNTSHFLWMNSFWDKKLDSGDTIIVPRQYERTAWLRDIKDVAAILGNIAVTAGVLIAAGVKF